MATSILNGNRASYQNHKGIKFGRGGKVPVIKERGAVKEVQDLKDAIKRLEESTTVSAYNIRVTNLRIAYANLKLKL